ncbi:PTS sugar transporter subunit IIA [bacterium BFN5]|nr:PTS sugar transporter subunit IIA [bacterium BFN5]
MVDLDLIELNMEAATAEEIIQRLGELMAAKQYVKTSYINAVLEREKSLPTGLALGDFCVAIPHTDSVHVNQSTIAIACLKQAALFQSMINPQEQLKVELVFLLAVKDPNSQVQLLKNLMAVFQNKELLLQIRNAASKREVSSLLNCLDL